MSLLVTRGKVRAGKGTLHVVCQGTFTYNPGSLVDAAGETSSDVTATGAALGDFVMVSAPYDLAGITVTAYVKSADTLSVRVQNESGGTLDLASGSWKYKVIR